MRRISVISIVLGTTMIALAGCGGSSQKPAVLNSGTASASSASSTPTSAATSTSSPSPTAASSTTGGVDLSLPADVNLVFDVKPTGDPLKDAAVQGWTDDMRALYKAIMLGDTDPNSPLIANYAMGSGLNSMVFWISGYKKADYVATGTKRYYDIQVLDTSSASGAEGATITYCDDESKFFDKDKATGQVHTTQVSLKDYSRITVILGKNPKTGTWMDGNYSEKQGDQQCRTLAG
jgi:hypothetical protein